VTVTPRLALGQAHAGGGAEAPQKAIPIRNLAPPPTKRKSPLLKYATVAVTVIALGVGGYFGYIWFRDRSNAKGEAADRNSGGGDAARTVAANNAPDATDPNGGGSSRATGTRQRGAAAAAVDGSTNAAGADTQPIIPASWTLEIGAAKIPDGKVNGMIAGTNFVAETARVDPVGAAQVLRLVQGQVASPDRELLVYLHLKPGEKLGGQSLSISKDMTGAAVPQVAKRWKPNPKFAPQLKSYFTGYAMKLELGQVADNTIPGKIFVALPDPEQTVVAGTFKASLAVIDPNAQVQVTPTATPASAAADDAAARRAAQDAFQRRYGVRQ